MNWLHDPGPPKVNIMRVSCLAFLTNTGLGLQGSGRWGGAILCDLLIQLPPFIHEQRKEKVYSAKKERKKKEIRDT